MPIGIIENMIKRSYGKTLLYKQTMNGKLVETNMGCVRVSKEAVGILCQCVLK